MRPLNQPAEGGLAHQFDGDDPVPRNPRTFRIRAMRLFLTYPQYDGTLDMQHVLDQVKVKFQHRRNVGLQTQKDLPTVAQIAVALEEHEEEGKHIHMCIMLTHSDNFQGQNGLDFLDSLVEPRKHGNYQAARNWKRVVGYVIKEGNYKSEGLDVQGLLSNSGGRGTKEFETIALKVYEGQKIIDLLSEFPVAIAKNLDKFQKFETFVEAQTKEPREEWYGIEPPEFIGNPNQLGNFQLAHWIAENFGSGIPMPVKRHKSSQLWIYAETNMGKTWIATQLSRFFRPYLVSYENGGWDEFWNDAWYDFAIFEEFCGQKKITWMNQFLEGTQFKLYNRHKGPVLKKKNLPCIILSNKMPQDVYHEVAQNDPVTFRAFLGRLKVIELKERVEIKFKHLIQEERIISPPQQIPLVSPSPSPTFGRSRLRRQNAVGNILVPGSFVDEEQDQPTQELINVVLVPGSNRFQSDPSPTQPRSNVRNPLTQTQTLTPTQVNPTQIAPGRNPKKVRWIEPPSSGSQDSQNLMNADVITNMQCPESFQNQPNPIRYNPREYFEDIDIDFGDLHDLGKTAQQLLSDMSDEAEEDDSISLSRDIFFEENGGKEDISEESGFNKSMSTCLCQDKTCTHVSHLVNKRKRN